MDRKYFLEKIDYIFENCVGNIVSEKEAIRSEVAGTQLFEKPLVGIGLAGDELFEKYKAEDVIGPWHKTPEEWLSGAKTVISLFFPFTESVKASNRTSIEHPSAEWLHGRVEGQNYLTTYMKNLQERLSAQGIKCCVPAIDERFEARMFSSNWSERHVAYVCGLGTFGLSKGLITEKGIAGRFASIIIDVELDADERKYSGVYDYCTMCGVCIRRCPAKAISIEEGKNHEICRNWVNKMGELYAPRYGCGLCQTKVPCESRIPNKL